MPTLVLYFFPGACSRATMIALEEAGAVYEALPVNLPKGEQRSPGYLARNPKGKVPTLLIDGVPLTENVAILGWLADTFPQGGLLPADPLGRAQALSAVSWLSSAVLTTMSRIVRPERISDDPAAAGGIRDKAREDIRASLAIADAHLEGRRWWLDTWSVADAYLFYIVTAVVTRGVSLDAFANLRAHQAAMEARPAVRRVLDKENVARTALAA